MRKTTTVTYRPLDCEGIPATMDDLLSARKFTASNNLNNAVQGVFETLIIDEDDSFRRLLNAGSNSEAVHGSMMADDYSAAMMIKEAAASRGVAIIIEANLEMVKKALRVVTRRYHGLSRRDRRQLAISAAPNSVALQKLRMDRARLVRSFPLFES